MFKNVVDKTFKEAQGRYCGNIGDIVQNIEIDAKEFEDITFAMGKHQETVTSFENDNSWNLEISEFLDVIKGKGEIINGTATGTSEYIAYNELLDREADNTNGGRPGLGPIKFMGPLVLFSLAPRLGPKLYDKI